MKKNFKKSLFGYAPDDVESTILTLEKGSRNEIGELKKQIEELQKERTRLKARVAELEEREGHIVSTLLAAELSAEEVICEADRKKSEIESRADKSAHLLDVILSNGTEVLEKLFTEIRGLKLLTQNLDTIIDGGTIEGIEYSIIGENESTQGSVFGNRISQAGSDADLLNIIEGIESMDKLSADASRDSLDQDLTEGEFDARKLMRNIYAGDNAEAQI